MPADISHLAEARAREQSLLERVRRENERNPPAHRSDPERTIVTISREYGAGGHSVGVKLIEHLGPEWQLWDREIINAVARSAKVRAELAAGLDDRMLSVQEQVLRYLVNCWTLSPDRYFHHLVQVLVSISHQGNKVIIGRGANFVLPASLRIRLCASERFRIDAIAKRENITTDAARTILKSTDRERTAFVSTLFGRDINEPTAYDMILRMDHLSIDSAVAAIEGAVRERMGPEPAVGMAHPAFRLASAAIPAAKS
ncbi:MAG: cytidylate kinase-like family protein [Capsulimonadaceae bacterium]|nr:cytidylate kinase-like family protein [Capsulimonadaceae bacterium]